MVINKKAREILCFTVYFFLLRFVGNVFASSIISSHVIAESYTILAKYFPFSQLHIVGF